jgi:hypothetical protein
MQLFPACFLTQEGALSAAEQAAMGCNVSDTTVMLKVRAKPVYRRGQFLGYHAVYPRNGGGFDIVKETYEGVLM